MQTLVTNDNITQVIKSIFDSPAVGFDTETYGTEFDDMPFALQFAIPGQQFYFNLHDYRDNTPVINRYRVVHKLREIFNQEDKIWYIHNAKFDMRRADLLDMPIKGHIHCTQTCERFINNQYIQYKLSACAKRRGWSKDDAVDDYIKEHKLWEWYLPPGKKTRKKKKHFHLVPFDIMFKYGCIDAELALRIGQDQREQLINEEYYTNDMELQKTAYAMEKVGMEVRREYATKAYEYEMGMVEQKRYHLSELAGTPYKTGPNWLRATFDKFDVPYQTNTKTGNPIFDKEALELIDHPIADEVRQFRKHEKYAGTYYATYKEAEVVHAQIKLHGTDTMRFSYADPNLQNVPKEEELDLNIPYQVRACFKPREDYCYVMVDFDQQEFRLLLDYAGEHELIRRINDDGEDVHQATADMVGVTRKMAKTLNFGLLYGMGAEKLAKQLKVSTMEAKSIKRQYFARLPKVKRLINQIISTAENRKYIKTWCGRKLFFPNKDFAYKAPNHLIQGGCADIARFAMPEIDRRVLNGMRSRLCLQVHDELLFEIHKTELEIVDAIVDIMENTYEPFNNMRLTCGVEHSWRSWGKRYVIEGKPIPEAG